MVMHYLIKMSSNGRGLIIMLSLYPYYLQTFRTINDQIGQLLDLLPYRGPDAFEHFCDALLECDHPHVAEYLKTHEG